MSEDLQIPYSTLYLPPFSWQVFEASCPKPKKGVSPCSIRSTPTSANCYISKRRSMWLGPELLQFGILETHVIQSKHADTRPCWHP